MEYWTLNLAICIRERPHVLVACGLSFIDHIIEGIGIGIGIGLESKFGSGRILPTQGFERFGMYTHKAVDSCYKLVQAAVGGDGESLENEPIASNIVGEWPSRDLPCNLNQYVKYDPTSQQDLGEFMKCNSLVLGITPEDSCGSGVLEDVIGPVPGTPYGSYRGLQIGCTDAVGSLGGNKVKYPMKEPGLSGARR